MARLVLCQDKTHTCKIGLFQGGETAFVARNAEEGEGILKARMHGTNVLLDVAHCEALRGRFVPAGRPSRIPMYVGLNRP